MVRDEGWGCGEGGGMWRWRICVVMEEWWWGYDDRVVVEMG